MTSRGRPPLTVEGCQSLYSTTRICVYKIYVCVCLLVYIQLGSISCIFVRWDSSDGMQKSCHAPMAAGTSRYFMIIEEKSHEYLLREYDVAGNMVASRVWAFGSAVDPRSSPEETLRGRAARFILALTKSGRCVKRGHSEAQALAGLRHACHVLGRLHDMIPTFRAVTGFMASGLDDRLRWSAKFKSISHGGHDVRRLRCIDYGNWEYARILVALSFLDDSILRNLALLRSSWPSMTLNPNLTDTGVKCFGDVVEIGLAALRGNEDATEIGVQADPELFQQLCNICQQVQLLDGILVTGRIKHRRDSVHMLQSRLLPPNLFDSLNGFKVCWRHAYNHDVAIAGILLSTFSG